MRIIKQERYDVGDIVLIRDWDDMEREYGLDKLGNIEIPDGWCFPIERKLWCGKTAPISGLGHFGNEYLIAELAPFVVFTPEMIAGKVVDDESMKEMEDITQNNKVAFNKKAIINAIDNISVNPDSAKTLAEMKEYLQGFEDMRNAVLDILDRNY